VSSGDGLGVAFSAFVIVASTSDTIDDKPEKPFADPSFSSSSVATILSLN
jgi:hypothetical protein